MDAVLEVAADDGYPDDYDDGCLEAENGWMRAAEYDQEARDEMYREDAMGYT